MPACFKASVLVSGTAHGFLPDSRRLFQRFGIGIGNGAQLFA
jgi:hypothetical protein